MNVSELVNQFRLLAIVLARYIYNFHTIKTLN